MKFFAIYKFELKKIFFILFATIFIIYLFDVLTFNQDLNNAFLSYIQGNYTEIHNYISILNIIWIILMAIFQFFSYDLNQRGNLPFTKSRLFLSVVSAGITIIAAAAVFYWAVTGFEYMRYSFVLSSLNEVNHIYNYSFFDLTINVFILFLEMLLVYLSVIIFIFAFKNPIIGCVFWFFWNLGFNISSSIISSSIFCFFNLFDWFDYSFYIILKDLKVIYSSHQIGVLLEFLILTFFVSASIISFILAFSLFKKTDSDIKNIFAKTKLGEFFIFADSGIIVFYLIAGSFNFYECTVFKKIIIILLSVLIGIISVLISRAAYKRGKVK